MDNRNQFSERKRKGELLSKSLRVFSDEDILSQIRIMSKQLGKTPSVKDWLAHYREFGFVSSTLITKRFETWSRAMMMAGLIPNYGTKVGHAAQYSKSTMMGAIFHCAMKTAKVPTMRSYKDWRTEEALAGRHWPHPVRIAQVWGSWTAAVEDSITPDFIKVIEETPDDGMILE